MIPTWMNVAERWFIRVGGLGRLVLGQRAAGFESVCWTQGGCGGWKCEDKSGVSIKFPLRQTALMGRWEFKHFKWIEECHYIKTRSNLYSYIKSVLSHSSPTFQSQGCLASFSLCRLSPLSHLLSAAWISASHSDFRSWKRSIYISQQLWGVETS